MYIHIVSSLDDFTEGEPIPSVVPAAGYGNHSCHDCQSSYKCPISDKSNIPNKCSFYWPPNVASKPDQGYWKYLDKIASERHRR